MTAQSFERLLKTFRIATLGSIHDALIADRSIRLTRPDSERLEGKVGKSRCVQDNASGLAKKLSKRLKRRRPVGDGARLSAHHVDARQRAVAKIHYFNHAGGGAAALKAHGKYISRDGARGEAQERGIDGDEAPARGDRHNREPQEDDRNNPSTVFYDKNASGIDGAQHLDACAKSDIRHFRIVLSAEEGSRLKDLPAYTREVMARAGAALGTELSWIAVDHKDTDNPHSHIVLRGRRANGQDLVLPRDFIKHGFRSIARDVATEHLGRRTPEQERAALQRTVRRHAPTKLDRIIESHARHCIVDLSRLDAPNGDPILTQAAKARVQELARMGLATDRGDGLFQFSPDWQKRLKAMELHLNIRKRIVRERVDRNATRQLAERALRKGRLDR